MLKIYEWNAELQENKEVQVSFKLQGINKPEVFVTAFQAGKAIIETLQGGTGTFIDYFLPITTLASVIQRALKKAQ